jgi:hypothetical protein
MAIPTVKCKNCGFIFSLQMMEDGNNRWFDLDPDHGCEYEMPDPLKKLPDDLPVEE